MAVADTIRANLMNDLRHAAPDQAHFFDIKDAPLAQLRTRGLQPEVPAGTVVLAADSANQGFVVIAAVRRTQGRREAFFGEVPADKVLLLA